MGFTIILVFLYAITPSLQFTVSICNCSRITQSTPVNFMDTDCNLLRATPNTTIVSYMTLTNNTGYVSIPGYLCSSWKKQKTVTTFFWSSTDTVFSTTAIDVTEQDCKKMVETKSCAGLPMAQEEPDIWKLNLEPTGEGRWWSKETYEMINCEVKALNLSRECEKDSCPMFTPFGQLNPKLGYKTRNHVTLIWDTAFVMKRSCVVRTIIQGTGYLTKSLDGYQYRLEDPDQEIDFHINAIPTRCDCRDKSCQLKGHAVKNEPDLMVFLSISNSTNMAVETTRKEINRRNKNLTRVDALINLSAHQQYLLDYETNLINEAAREIRYSQCEIQKLRHDLATTTAQYAPWLSASQMNLPPCKKIAGHGKALAVVTCAPLEVTFNTEITPCGPIPRYKNFTIGPEGWELINYNPCMYGKGQVNFRGKPHYYNGTTWKELVSENIFPDQKLAHTFHYENVRSDLFQPPSNEAYLNLAVDHISAVSEMIAVANEHAAQDDKGYTWSVNKGMVGVESVRALTTTTTWWGTIKFWSAWILLAALALILMRFLYACGVFGVVWKLCCRIKRPEKIRDIELAPSFHPINPVINHRMRAASSR